ncbi:hypothetical protein LX15_002286 [Streptoalloteichus tenebrarius]|uniref:Uncharacterized protein n=1 Tax=Streptoalloteichus tenebrarius (strain ATCC 17920 / DSM 40477 / JCM 4838 / CBS 697.72 / NBRC 16177 / NCIMB 11028 / NRRL B-12390 / A12253. 1 / ISP 5477) TaxID=1933 RepID=A0ABT1HST9_STRSD|nr:hypothetical protein [Streptoalloteichus tenebrarius]MCP2258588.1 hypothetical protein [Streptoalloteichus tenebrarius]BFF04040.1 hypothetical protein GCM10020241_57150 [Streptoalloteichus tenebrarius]
MADHNEIERFLRPGERVVWSLRLPLHRPRFRVPGLAKDGRENNALGFVQGIGRTAFRTAKAAASVAVAVIADDASGEASREPNGEVHGDRPDCLAVGFTRAAAGRSVVALTDQRLLVLADRTGLAGAAREIGETGLAVGRRVLDMGRDLISRDGAADRQGETGVAKAGPGEEPEWAGAADALRGVEIADAPRTLEKFRLVWHFADGSRLDHRVGMRIVNDFAQQPGFFRR